MSENLSKNKNEKMGFSTKLKHWDLPKDTEVELRFENDSKYALFCYTSIVGTRLGHSIGLKLSSPILKHIKEKAIEWKFEGIEHVTPTAQNPRDFYWIKFRVEFHYPDLVKILEAINELP